MAQRNGTSSGKLSNKLMSKVQKDCEFIVQSELNSMNPITLIYRVIIYGKGKNEHVRINTGWHRTLKSATKAGRKKFFKEIRKAALQRRRTKETSQGTQS